MDVMTRRHMLLSLLSGGDAMIGSFSHYKKVTAKFPNASNAVAWASNAVIPCDFVPKVVVFYGGNTETSGNIARGCLAFDLDSDILIRAGGIYYRNAANGNFVVAAYSAFEIDGTNHSAANTRYQYYDGNIYICRTGTNGYWSSTDEYTFEIYG